MKQVDICSNCYAHLMENRIYLYVDNEFTEILYIDDVENLDDPIPLIAREIELSSRPSLYSCVELI
jgi:hypothetical protein